MNKSLRTVVITLTCFIIYFLFNKFYFGDLVQFFYENLNQAIPSYLLGYLIVGIPLFIGIFLLHGFRDFFSALGLKKSILRPMVYALVCTLPMFIGSAILFDFNQELTFSKVFVSAICAAFFEEVYFRGFFFGQLHRNTKLGFIPSIALGAILFAIGHLYQSQDLSTLLGIFFTTLMGAVLFAWVYVEWKYNLWASIFLHFFMNLSWLVFSVSDNALGGIYPNIFRGLTIALAICLVIFYKKRIGEKMMVNRHTLFWKKKN